MKRQDNTDADESSSGGDGAKRPKDHARFSYLLPVPRRRPRIGDDFQAVIEPVALVIPPADNHHHIDNAVVTEEDETSKAGDDDNNAPQESPVNQSVEVDDHHGDAAK